MSRAKNMTAFTPALERRLAPMFPNRDLGNGTPFHAGLASLLAHDLAATGAKGARRADELVAALTDAQITQAAEALTTLSGGTGADMRMLPYGTCYRACGGSGIHPAEGNQVLRPVMGVPGLFLDARARVLPERPGMNALRAAVRAAVDGVNEAVNLDDVPVVPHGKTQWRIGAPVYSGVGRTATLFEIVNDPDVMTKREHASIAARLRERALTAVGNAALIRKHDEQTEFALGDLLRDLADEGVPFRYLGTTVEHRYGTTKVVPHFMGLGNDLRPEQWSIEYIGDLVAQVTSQASTQRRRARMLADMGADRTIGATDAVTMAALEDLVADVPAVLREVGNRRSLTVQAGRFEKRSDPVRLVWRDGRLQSSFQMRLGRAEWNYGRLILKGVTLPEAAINRLSGRRVDELLDHPWMRDAGVISSVARRRVGDVVIVNVAAASRRFALDTGLPIEA